MSFEEKLFFIQVSSTGAGWSSHSTA